VSTAIKERVRPFALRFASRTVSQEEIEEMFQADPKTRIRMTKISPTHTVTGNKYDIEPDDE